MMGEVRDAAGFTSHSERKKKEKKRSRDMISELLKQTGNTVEE
jgi:hypothetical protein